MIHSQKKLNAHLILLLCVVILLPACKIATIRRLDSNGNKSNEAQTFNSRSFVDSIWESNLKPALSQALELSTLLKELDKDAEGAKVRYGHRTGSGPYYFIIKGSGRVVSVDTSSRMGTAMIAVASYDQRPVMLQIGPILKGTAIRDALPFIKTDQFANQIHFAEVANELNSRVEKTILDPVDRTQLKGRRIVFSGTAGADDNQPLLITPVELAMGEGR